MIQMRTRYEWMTPTQRVAYADLEVYWRMMSNATTHIAVKCGYAAANRVLNEHFPADAATWNGLDKHYHNCMRRLKNDAVNSDGTTVTIKVADDVTITITKNR